MTLASDISTTSTSLSDIKNAIIAKGVTPSGNITTYAAAIGNIQTGGIGITREIKNGVYQIPTENFTFSLPSDATDIGDYALYYAFYNSTSLTSVDLSSLTTVSGRGLYYAFYGCTGLTSVDLSSLTTVSGTSALSRAFQGCTGLTSVSFPALTTVSSTNALNYAFAGCTGLTSVSFPALTTISGNSALNSAFNGCTGLTNIYFRALTTTSFGSNKNQFGSMMANTGTKVHRIHFPSNMQSTISGLAGYPTFGGTSGYVVLAFDLPATS